MNSRTLPKSGLESPVTETVVGKASVVRDGLHFGGGARPLLVAKSQVNRVPSAPARTAGAFVVLATGSGATPEGHTPPPRQTRMMIRGPTGTAV